MYSFGEGEHGQLGTGKTEKQKNITQISALQGVSKIRAYGHSSAAIDNEGRLFVWGECLGEKLNR